MFFPFKEILVNKEVNNNNYNETLSYDLTLQDNIYDLLKIINFKSVNDKIKLNKLKKYNFLSVQNIIKYNNKFKLIKNNSSKKEYFGEYDNKNFYKYPNKPFYNPIIISYNYIMEKNNKLYTDLEFNYVLDNNIKNKYDDVFKHELRVYKINYINKKIKNKK